MLLMLGISAVVSCNSYDVEGKPEIASNPAKKVFAYNPWEKDESNASKTDDNSGKDDANTNEENDGDNNGTENDDANGEVSDDTNDDANGEVSDEEDDANGEVADDTNGNNETNDDTNGTNGDDSGENGTNGEGAVQDGTVVVRAATTNEDEITEKFEIYNRGVTGELKIRKINLLDPNGKLIETLDDADYKELFKMQIQKMEKGLAASGFGGKVLSFDNMSKDNEADHIAALCPLTEKKGSDTGNARVCKDGFDKAKYNPSFTILLTYSGKAVKALKDKALSSEEYKQSGDFSIEICTNDPTKGSTDTCKGLGTSYRIQVTRQAPKPPKPIIHVAFEYPIQKPMSYRNIYDQVQMNLKDTCVALKDDPNTCDPEWESKYYIKYKWEMTESPTPLLDDSKLRLTESTSDSAGQWIPDDGVRDNPKRAAFTGLMITPRRYDDQPNEQYNAEECAKCGDEPSDPNNEDKYFFKTLSNYLLCRQKYCEETRTKYYKINIQAEAVDRTTDLVSDTADITVVPKIIPQARVVAQLTWKQGFKTKAESESKEGAAIDIDIHMIKKESLEAPQYSFTPTEGLLGTSYRSEETEAACPYTMPECEKYWRHDDCSFSDQGLTNVENGRTIQWHASLDIDNTWGGNNYETPETIGLGPIIDKDPEDGVPDTPIIDDQYLLVVNYVGCTWKSPENTEIPDSEDRCNRLYTGEDGVYEVDARVEILIDGAEAPRKAGSDRPADSYASKNFKIKVNEWKTIALVKWDNSWKGPETNQKYTGNALVTDVAMADQEIALNAQTHPVCTYNMSDAVLLPIWNANEYVKRVTEVDENGGRIGTCGAVDPNTNPGGDEGGETTPDEDNGEGEDDSDEETDDSDNE